MELYCKQFKDELGNSILTSSNYDSVKVRFSPNSKNNQLIIEDNVFLGKAEIVFTGSNAKIKICKNKPGKPHTFKMRIGEDSQIEIGESVTIEKNASFFACEGANISIGRDCMISTNVQIRADDSHPIFDATTGERLNFSRDIKIGEHCWIGFGAVILKGVTIDSGTVVGMGSIVTKSLPNNVVAAGNPARILRKSIAWERPNLGTTEPRYKPHIKVMKKTAAYWRETDRDINEQIYQAYLQCDSEKVKSLAAESDLKKITTENIVNIATVYFREGSYDQALDFYLKAKSRDVPSELNIDILIGNTLFRLRSYELARRYFEVALLRSPLNTTLITSLVITNFFLDDKETVRRLLKSYVKVLPSVKIKKILQAITDYANKPTRTEIRESVIDVLKDISI